MSPRTVILICGGCLITLGGIVALVEYNTTRANEQEPEEPFQKPKHTPPQRKVSHQELSGGISDCSYCHTNYTPKDTVLISTEMW